MSRTRSNQVLNETAKMLRKIGNGMYHMQPSVLIEARPLEATGGPITFSLKPEEVKENIDIRLKKGDAHKITHLGFLLAKKRPGKNGLRLSTLYSYPNAVEFPDSVADAVKNQNFEIIYTGSVAEIKVGDKTSLEELHGTLFRRIPQTQQSSANNENQFDIFDMCMELPRPISVNGDMDIQITYKIPTLSDGEKIQYAAESPAGGQVYLIFFALGGKVKDFNNYLNTKGVNKDAVWGEFVNA